MNSGGKSIVLVHIIALLVLCSYVSTRPFAAADPINSTAASPRAIKDLTLNLKEKRLLEQFKDNVKSFLANQPERFQEDAYLVRWLRGTEFDLKQAEKKLIENFQWREKQRIDQILNEDWSDFSFEFPYTISSYDKYNQPILTAQMGLWDFRQVILSGKRDRMLRYIYKLLETLDQEIYKQQKKGFLVTRCVEILDLAGFNLRTHGCMQCIPLYLEMVLGLERSYPSLMDKVVMVNAPGVFETVLNAVKPAMTPETRSSIQLFGANTKRWKSFLDKFVDEDELPIEFGGNKVFLEYNGV